MVSASRPVDAVGRAERVWVLCPNRSLSWPQAKWAFAAMVTVSLAVALGFAVLGFWPILPFAGAELALLGSTVYWVQRQAQRREVIAFKENLVAVEKGRERPEQRWHFERTWLQVRLVPARVAGHPSRLVLRSHGRQVSVGDFLVEPEREFVARELTAALGH